MLGTIGGPQKIHLFCKPMPLCSLAFTSNLMICGYFDTYNPTACNNIIFNEQLLLLNFYLNWKLVFYLQPQLLFSHRRCYLGQLALWGRGTLWSPHQIALLTPAPAEQAKLPDLFFLPRKKINSIKYIHDITKLYYLIFAMTKRLLFST